MAVQVKGLEEVLKALKDVASKTDRASLRGLIRSSIIVRNATEKQSPKTPVDTGNLRASWFTVTNKGTTEEGTGAEFKGSDAGKMSTQHSRVLTEAKSEVAGSKPGVGFGFSANYAAEVHEAAEGRNWNRPGSGPKFLEQALLKNKNAILKVIKEETKID